MTVDILQTYLFYSPMCKALQSLRNFPEVSVNLQDWLYGADAGEEVQVMTELPQGLRKEIALAINVPLFKKLSFFHTFPDHVLSVIASHMSPLQVLPSQGFKGNALVSPTKAMTIRLPADTSLQLQWLSATTIW